MALFKAAQVKKFVNGALFLGNLSVYWGSVYPVSILEKRIQLALDNALLGQAAHGLNLPSQDSITPITLRRREGYHLASPRNYVNVYDAYKRKVVTVSGDEIYGRLEPKSPGATTINSARETAANDVDSIGAFAVANGHVAASVQTNLANARDTFDANNPAPRSPEGEAAYNVYVRAATIADDYMTVNGAGATVSGIYNAVRTINDDEMIATQDYIAVVFYSNLNGVETPADITSASLDGANGLNFEMGYVYSFENLPSDFATGIKGSFVSDDPVGSTANAEQRQLLIYAALNDFGALAYGVRPSTTVFVHVNGISFNSNQVTIFEIEAVTNRLIWKPTAPYPLEDEDNVIVTYISNGIATV